MTGGKNRIKKTYSEGQGYGMIIVTILASYDPEAHSIFNGLWFFSRSHPSRIDNPLMSGEVPVRLSKRDSAFDGDCDIAYALLLADKQWGNNGDIR